MASLTKNEKKLDRLFSKWVRKSNANHQGLIRCYTCGVYKMWDDCDAGHYVNRNHKGTRWDERNVKPQCKKCNRFESGKSDEFALKLIKEYGHEILEELNRHKWTPFMIDDLQVIGMIENYKQKLKEL